MCFLKLVLFVDKVGSSLAARSRDAMYTIYTYILSGLSGLLLDQGAPSSDASTQMAVGVGVGVGAST